MEYLYGIILLSIRMQWMIETLKHTGPYITILNPKEYISLYEILGYIYFKNLEADGNFVR